MKLHKLTAIALASMAIGALVGCNQPAGEAPLVVKKGDTVYTETLLFDVKGSAHGQFKLDIDKTVKSVKIGRNVIKFAYKNGILTLSCSSLKRAGAGEHSAIVAFDEGGSTTVDILSANFIKTPQQFQDINKNLDGYYVLANDLDFTNFGNFEPLGRMADETDPDNHYFHGVLEGNGHKISNVTCSYSTGPVMHSDNDFQYYSNYDIYSGNSKRVEQFKIDSHVMGDNIGLFQCIGDAGVVRNITFDNVDVHGRTIVGVIAGNLMGKVQNCLITSTCSVLMDTHFWDDDCNCGGAFGIVAGTGRATNVVSLTTNVGIRAAFQDYGDQYIGKSGSGYDHGGSVNNPFWRFWNNDKELSGTTTKTIDSNGSQTNGTYSFVGKCWGLVENSVAAKFRFAPNGSSERDSFFGQTHKGANKPTSGDSDLGELLNCAVYDESGLKAAANYESFSPLVWNIVDGSFPSIKQNIVPTEQYNG